MQSSPFSSGFYGISLRSGVFGRKNRAIGGERIRGRFEIRDLSGLSLEFDYDGPPKINSFRARRKGMNAA